MREVDTKKKPKGYPSLVKFMEKNGDFTKKTLDKYKYLNKKHWRKALI